MQYCVSSGRPTFPSHDYSWFGDPNPHLHKLWRIWVDVYWTLVLYGGEARSGAILLGLLVVRKLKSSWQVVLVISDKVSICCVFVRKVGLGGFWLLKSEDIACQFLHYPQSKDIGLKSLMGRKGGFLLSTGKGSQKTGCQLRLQSLRISQRQAMVICFWKKVYDLGQRWLQDIRWIVGSPSLLLI